MENYKFNEYQSIFDDSFIVYGLAKDGVERVIEGELFLEVTSDFKSVKMVKADSLKIVGNLVKQY